jgi:glycosyltransferase involved in cell wall biosynthesis
MRVLFVTNMWPDEERPWYGTFIKSQAESLERLGVSIDVEAIRGYSCRREYLKATSRLVRLNRASPFDLVHAHYGHAAAVARSNFATPLVVSYCGDDLLGTPSESGGVTVRSRLEAGVFRQIARVAAATITKSAEMERALPRPRQQRNHVIPNGVDLDRFAPLPRNEARRRVGWDRDQRVVLFVGDPGITRKNFPLAKAACERARAVLPDLTLRVAHGCAPSDVPLLMSAADAIVLTSTWEGSPNVVKEAMANELPVVATPVGDVEERLRGVEGCFVCLPDSRALSEGLVSAVSRDRAPAAREAVQPLGLEAVARRVLAVYEEARARARDRQRGGS